MEEKYKNLPLRIGVGVVLLNNENKQIGINAFINKTIPEWKD